MQQTLSLLIIFWHNYRVVVEYWILRGVSKLRQESHTFEVHVFSRLFVHVMFKLDIMNIQLSSIQVNHRFERHLRLRSTAMFTWNDYVFATNRKSRKATLHLNKAWTNSSRTRVIRKSGILDTLDSLPSIFNIQQQHFSCAMKYCTMKVSVASYVHNFRLFSISM